MNNATAVAAAGADAVGLNFYEKSKRFVSTQDARAISESLPDRIEVVGVFVNSEIRRVAEIATAVGLTTVQFHGDESVDTIAAFHEISPGTDIIRAFRVGPSGTQALTESVNGLKAAGVPLRAILADAHVVGEYGGTGRLVDPALLQDRPPDWPPLILAGGLTPDTIAKAIERVRPWGVDTASGVESAPGVKCAVKTGAFIQAARTAGEENNPSANA